MYKAIIELYATSIIAGRWKLEKVPTMFKEQVIKRIDEIKVEKGENK